jgi:WD40-like Beta Propeller Repeat
MADPNGQARPSGGTRLDSWKEISAYLKRDPRTLQRWEKKERLPVHRHAHESQVSIYAYTSELDAWLASRTLPSAPLEAHRHWYQRPRIAAASAGAIAAVIVLVAFARSGGPPVTPTQRAFRQVWAGKEVDFWAAISADGRYFSYTDTEDGTLWIHDFILGQNHRVTRWPKETAWALDAVFAPDGKSIAYTRFPHDNLPWEIHISELDGKNDRMLFRDSGSRQLRLQDWSENGKWIAATISSFQEQQLALISPGDGAVRVLKQGRTVDVRRAAFSRDGRYLAYDSPGGPGHGGDIFLASTDGKEDRAVVEYPSNEFLVGWSPRG